MERTIVRAGIRLIGLWWILFDGGTGLYFILTKSVGLPTTSGAPVASNILAVLFDLVCGLLIIQLAPAITRMIFGAEKPAGN